MPQAVPADHQREQSGQVRVDNTNGPGRGWIYQPYRHRRLPGGDGEGAATTPTSAGWKVNTGGQRRDRARRLPVAGAGHPGNVYAVWVGKRQALLQLHADRRRGQQPGGGRAARHEVVPEQVITPVGIGSAIFPEVVAGDPGKIAIAFDGTSDYSGVTDGAPPNTAGTPTSPWSTTPCPPTARSGSAPARSATGSSTPATSARAGRPARRRAGEGPVAARPDRHRPRQGRPRRCRLHRQQQRAAAGQRRGRPRGRRAAQDARSCSSPSRCPAPRWSAARRSRCTVPTGARHRPGRRRHLAQPQGRRSAAQPGRAGASASASRATSSSRGSRWRRPRRRP